VIAVKEPGTREAHLLEAVQEGVLLCICVCVFVFVCVFPVKEPGTREAHLLEAVQEGVCFCICVCVCCRGAWCMGSTRTMYCVSCARRCVRL